MQYRKRFVHTYKVTMKSKGLREAVGPEDLRPLYQSYLQAQLVYKGKLQETRDKVTEQLKSILDREARKRALVLLEDVKRELKKMDLGIKVREDAIKKGHLRLTS